MKRLLLAGVIAAGLAAPAFAGPDPGPPPGQALGSEFLPGTPANMYADLKDAARRCDKKQFETIKFSISQSGKDASHFQTPLDLANWENWERARAWQKKIGNWTLPPCPQTASVGANTWGQGTFFPRVDPTTDVSLRYAGEFAGFRVAAGIGFVENSGRTTYEGTGFSTSGDKGGVCVDGYIQRPFWNIPGAGTVNLGGMAAFCTGPSFSQINPGNGLPHQTKIGDYWLVGGRVSADKFWVAQGGVSQNFFRKTSIYGEFGAAISDVKIEVPGLVGANTTSTQPFFGIGVSGEVPWGGGVTQSVDAAALELYVGYRQFDAKADTGFGVQTKTEIRSITTGARIRF